MGGDVGGRRWVGCAGVMWAVRCGAQGGVRFGDACDVLDGPMARWLGGSITLNGSRSTDLKALDDVVPGDHVTLGEGGGHKALVAVGLNI